MKTKFWGKLNPLPAHTCISLGALAGLVFTAVIFLFPGNSSDQNEQWQELYAQSLANVTAKQAITAVFTSDMIGLQVLLQDVSQQPKVILAATYDVENTVLAQAGETRFDTAKSTNAIAPIVMDESIAGYVSVTVEFQNRSSLARFFLVGLAAAMLMSLATWGILKTHTISLPFANQSKTSPELPEANDNTHFDNENIIEIEGQKAKDHVIAVIHVKNLNVIREQLSGESFRATLNRFERILHDVLALYGGAQCELEDNCYILSFAIAENRDEILFRAICSAHLVLELGGIVNDVPLDLAALVSIDHGEELDSRPLPITRVTH